MRCQLPQNVQSTFSAICDVSICWEAAYGQTVSWLHIFLTSLGLQGCHSPTSRRFTGRSALLPAALMRCIQARRGSRHAMAVWQRIPVFVSSGKLLPFACHALR